MSAADTAWRGERAWIRARTASAHARAAARRDTAECERSARAAEKLHACNRAARTARGRIPLRARPMTNLPRPSVARQRPRQRGACQRSVSLPDRFFSCYLPAQCRPARQPACPGVSVTARSQAASRGRERCTPRPPSKGAEAQQRRNSAEHQGRANSPLAVRQRGARQDLRDLARAQPQVRRARRSSAPKTRRMCNCYRGARVRAATHLSLAPRRASQRGRYAQQMWPRRSVVRSRSTTSAGVPVGPSCAPLPRSPLRKPACCCA